MQFTFIMGIGCLGLEIFVVPGFGVFGVSGAILVLAALIMAGHSWSTDLATNVEDLTWNAGRVIVSMGVVAAIAIVTARFLPSMPGFDSMVLGPPGSGPDEPRLRLDSTEMINAMNGEISVGERGHSLTILRPSGKAQFENRVCDVVSEGPFIVAHSDLEVVAVSGNRIVVRRV